MSKSLFARLAEKFEPQSEIDRREFLRITLAAGAGLLISGNEAVWGKESKGEWGSRRILVIGAGFAGLACAHELLAAGCHVTLVEARNRVGGRVITLPNFVKGKNIEGGAEFIGTNHPAWLAYARHFGLELFEDPGDVDADSALFFDSHLLAEREAKALFDEMKIVKKQMTVDAVAVNEDEPWLSPNAGDLDQRNTASWLDSLSVSALCKKAFESQLQADNGVALKHQSYLGNLTQVKGGGLEKYWTESEIYRCRGGNERLAQKFAEQLQTRLKLNTPIGSIKTTDSKATVRTSGNEVIEADDVVLAIPPSVWSQIQFDPQLPDVLKPQMGTGVKYVTSVETKFWEAKRQNPDTSSDTMVSMTWDATAGQEGPGSALTAFSGGPAAAVCERLFARKGRAAYTQVLEKIFPSYASNVKNALFMDWPKIRWTMAGYSFPSPGEIIRLGPILHNGIGRLHFAGEHTCFKFVGYMEGALNSGASLARRLLNESGAVSSPTPSRSAGIN
jgi:monoamine oxidase